MNEEAQVDRIILKPNCEYRFEVQGEDEVLIRLSSGTAELFGVELAKDRDYRFRKCQLAIFTWHGCELVVTGKCAVSYTSDETPMASIVNIHTQLDQIRIKAMNTKTAGPRVLITGPTDSGKSTVTQILLNYALRMGRKPTFVDLDVAHGLLSVPGTITATPLETNCMSVEDDFILTAPIAYYFGHASLKDIPELYKYQVTELAKRVDQRLANDAEVNASGIIVNTSGLIDNEGYQAILHCIQALHIDLVIVLGQDRLYSELNSAVGSTLTVIKLPRSDGVVQRSNQLRHQLRMDGFHTYFYGKKIPNAVPTQSLYEYSPHVVELAFEDINIFRVHDLKVSDVMLPVGQVDDVQRLRVLPVDKGPELAHCIAAVIHQSNVKDDDLGMDPQSLLDASAAGFVQIKAVNVQTNRITLLVPCHATSRMPTGLPNYDLATGICVCLIGTTLSNFGLNIQKFSFTIEQHLPEADRRPYTSIWQWWVGLSCVIIGSIGDFAALSFAAQSVIMPVGSFTLVANIFFAHFWLKERLTWNDLHGTIFIVCGAVIVCIFGAHESTNYTLDELVALYRRWDMLFYAIFIFAVILFFYLLNVRSQAMFDQHGGESIEYSFYKKWHPLSYAALSGVVGAQSVMFAKSTGELIKQTLSGHNQFNHILSFVLLIALGIAITTQTHVLAMGLKHFDALYIVPVFTCFFITFSILGGAVYFEEFKSYSLTQGICFPLGVIITIYGISVLAKRDMSQPSSKGYTVLAP
ncbi:pre-mRNA cleavage complex II protein Clp1 [Thraustotheca clavata]|uniref:Protein CLP1 homolog n=1 Tax=Thraustotheca clavata TaxID=74557 RepID=A0A1V9Z768_9STRA|nr:pre-mRNA cleavage complex II protein Clp1 [Thraustotheca clavata]